MHDTHAHLELYLEKLDLLDPTATTLSGAATEHLQQSLSAHEWVIQPTVSLENYTRVRQLFANFDFPLHYLLGAHPEIVTAEFDVDAYITKLNETHPSCPPIIGVGEIGLDYFYSQDADIISKQKALFRRHIALALDWDLPIIIHCREAFADVFSILDEYPAIHGKFLIHCFTGDRADLEGVLLRGGLVAYGGMSTYKNAPDLQATIPVVSLDKFVFETDLPYLSPHPKRGRICEPGYIEHVASNFATRRDTTSETVWSQSRANAERFFALTKTTSSREAV